jgi:sigma-B regulation protein RsbU (phosphoserine phosphatase)
MIFTSAGLNEPLLKSGTVVRRLSGSGNKLPIGVRVDSEYQEKKQQLKTGDVILFSTDGITEARNSHKEYFGYGKLETLLKEMDVSSLTAKDIKDKIIAEVENFSKGALQHDDMAIVVVKVL